MNTFELKTKYIDELAVYIVKGKYFKGGGDSFSIVSRSGEHICQGSVNLLDLVKLEEGMFCLKSYSENEGLFEALNELGFLTVHSIVKHGFVHSSVCSWTDKVKEFIQ